jgi:K+-sensing histidine kinase KdpD
MMMSMSLLEDRMDRDDQINRQIFNTSTNSGKRLLSQIQSLLDIRKMQDGRMPLERRAVPVNALFDACIQEYRSVAAVIELGLDRQTDVDDALKVDVDPEIVGRVLANLVWNALQYAEGDSTVQLGIDGIVDGQVDLFVANRGRAIPRELHEVVFDIFHAGRLEDKKHKAPSSGLGLAFCRMACDAHGGSIGIVSPWEDEEGVKVVFSLPKAGE